MYKYIETRYSRTTLDHENILCGCGVFMYCSILCYSLFEKSIHYLLKFNNWIVKMSVVIYIMDQEKTGIIIIVALIIAVVLMAIVSIITTSIYAEKRGKQTY